MQTENIVVDRGKARELYRKYRAHRHYSTPIDERIVVVTSSLPKAG